MPAIAGNSTLLHDLRQMRRGSHLPHALLLHGERGCGKKAIAKWFSMLVLCEHPDTAPCGHCKSCRLILDDAHPDVLTAEHSGKRMGFSVETVRAVRREAAILPNNGDTRIFIFSDADEMSVQAQNALLKSVEEPPAHACFLFTAETVGALLPTLLSRMTVKAVFPVTPEECAESLRQRGFAAADIEHAVHRFGGNIGKCIAYLQDDAMRQAAEQAAAITRLLAEHDEYTLLKTLTKASADRDSLRRTLELTDAQLRDAAILTMDGSFPRIGCDAAAAEALAQHMTPRRTLRMHGAILQALEDLDSNVGAALTVTALCAALMEC